MGTYPDVLVIGGGVIGLTTAYYLSRDGATVTLLDRSAPGSEASWAGAGIIPPGNPDGAATSYDRLRAVSSRAFPTLSAELRERTGIDNGYRVCGGIEVFEEPAPQITRAWKAEGIEFHPIDGDEVRGMEPNLRVRATEAYFLPGMAQVRNPRHLKALVAACRRLGVRIASNVSVVRFRTERAQIAAAVAESGAEFVAGRFLIASGAWSDRLLVQLGLRPGIAPVRGQMALFLPPAPLLKRVVCVGKRYLVPREDGRTLVGSTEEPEAGFEKRTTESGIAGLVEFASGIVPSLGTLALERSWAGLRPGSPDGMPFLGQIPGWDNAFVAAGHFRAGIQLSPATGRLMAALIQGRPPELPIEAFRPDRVPGPPVTSPFRS